MVTTAAAESVQSPQIVAAVCKLLAEVPEAPLFEGNFQPNIAVSKLLGPDGVWTPDSSSQIIRNSFASGIRVLKAQVVLNSPIWGATRRQMLVVSSVPPDGNDCHACGVLLSAYTFVDRDTGWFLESSNSYLDETGSFGQPPRLQTIKLGPNLWGFAAEASYMAQGQSTTDMIIYAPVLDKFTKVLTYEEESDNSGFALTDDSRFSSKTSISYGPGVRAGFFDIHLASEGKNNEGLVLPHSRLCTFSSQSYNCR
jgi:hypothetical protein